MSHAIAIAVSRGGSRETIAGVLATLAVYAPVFPSLVHEWATYATLSHGFAIPLIALYLVWIRRAALAAVPAAPTWRGLPFVAFGLILYAIATLGSEPFLARASLPLTLGGTVLLLGGPTIARHALPGIAYLLFMLPPPYVALKELTRTATLFDASVTAAILPWLGVPVFREGNLLHLANMTLQVADACSSIPAITSLLALGGAYGLVRERSGPITLLLMGAAIPLSIASNIVRIVLTAWGAYYLGPIAINNVIHTWHGTSVFLLTLAGLVVFDAGLSRLGRGR